MKALSQTVYESYDLRIKDLFEKRETDLVHVGIAVEHGTNLTNYWQEYKGITVLDNWEPE